METLVEGIKKCMNNPHYANTEAGRNFILDGVKQVVDPEIAGNSLDGSNINLNVVVPNLKSNDIQAQAQSQKCGGCSPKTIKKPVYKNVTVYKEKKQERIVKVPCGTKKVLVGYEEHCIEPEKKCYKVKPKKCKKKCESSSSWCSSSSSWCSSTSYKIVCKKGCKNVCVCKKKNDCHRKKKYEKYVECKPQLKCKEKVRPVHDFQTKKVWVEDKCSKNNYDHYGYVKRNDKFLNPDYHNVKYGDYKNKFDKPCLW